MIRSLTKNQVQDPARGSFFVGLQATKDRYKGLPVYKDAFGFQFVIVDAEF